MASSILTKSSSSAIYSGCGNTFVVTNEPHFALKAAQTCQSNKTDGLILIKESLCADFKIECFNSDGSEAKMCGNGLRCAVQFTLEQLKIIKPHFSVETASAIYPVFVEKKLISISFPFPEKVEKIQFEELDGYFLNTGVPHAVFFVNDLNDPSWMKRAPTIRCHSQFAPQGTNVNFATLGTPIKMRTFERGVEGETESCGTGTVAVAIAARQAHTVPSLIKIEPLSKIILTVSIQEESVLLSGPATLVTRDISRY